MHTEMNLFTYGTLMDQEIMRRVSGENSQSCVGTLHDFARKQVRDEVYPAIIQCAGSSVGGIVYFGLSPDAIDRLDKFEGNLYDRREVDVVGDKGEIVVANTYIIAAAFANRISDEDWDFQAFLKDGKNAFQQHYAGYAQLD